MGQEIHQGQLIGEYKSQNHLNLNASICRWREEELKKRNQEEEWRW